MRLWVQCVQIEHITDVVAERANNGFYEIPDSMSNDFYIKNFDRIRVKVNAAFEIPSGIEDTFYLSYQCYFPNTNHVTFPVDVNDRCTVGTIKMEMASNENPLYGEKTPIGKNLHTVHTRTDLLKVRYYILPYALSIIVDRLK